MNVDVGQLQPARSQHDEIKVIFASSLGSVFEWYDFYLYGSLAAIIAKKFFSGVNDTTAFIFALLAFAAGFAVRPLGSLVFGRLGDLAGRKKTFLLTIIIMGAATSLVGVLPSYATWGVAAPLVLISLRMLQGLALGGEYGGAATYVAEHAPPGKRGLYTAWIQTTATLGFFLSLIVILGTKIALSEEAFSDWGWRIPFIFSVVLVSISVWIRTTLHESPVFLKMKEEGKNSNAPIKEALGQWSNVRLMLIALFGLVAGQTVIWYGSQFYTLFFLTQTLKLDSIVANLLLAAALLIGTPLIVLAGALSDRIGRKPVMVAGFILAALLYFPLFHGLTRYANPALDKAQRSAPVSVVADQATCSLQIDPTGTATFTSSCDIAKAWLAKNSVAYTTVAAPTGALAIVRVGTKTITSYEAKGLDKATAKLKADAFARDLGGLVHSVGYPEKGDTKAINFPAVIAILIALVGMVALVYGPIAAALVDMFPPRIRYTAMSLPYHIGNGWFGGFLPTTAFALVAATGNIYAGLWYPVVIAALSAVVAILFVPSMRTAED